MKTKTQTHICDNNIRCASDVIFHDTFRLVVQFLLQQTVKIKEVQNYSKENNLF